MQEKGIHEDAVNFHKNALLVDAASDGVKAFTGIIMEIIAGDPHVIIIDEPEAFLHPALAYKLGFEMSRAAGQQGKTVLRSPSSAATGILGC